MTPPLNTFLESRQPILTEKMEELGKFPTFETSYEKYGIYKELQYEENNDSNSPIDLTNKVKKTRIKTMVSSVLAPIDGPANLLASLASITEKVPISCANRDYFPIDESILPHKYVTDRALQDAKIKQSQINSESLNTVRSSLNENLKMEVTSEKPGCNPSFQKPTEVELSMMETLAEVAAISIKLNVSKEPSSGLIAAEVRSNEKENARSVASKYVKLTQGRKNYLVKEEEEESCGSDQEIVCEKLPAEMIARTVVVGEGGFKNNTLNDMQTVAAYSSLRADGRPICTICSKTFQKASQLRIHINIHYMERKFRCEPCAVSFRTQGHLLKHERSAQHQSKVSMTSTFGVPTQSNPRPFKCKECKVAFRIHGHLAKHLRSKLHVMKLECLQKIPFGTYAEIERSGISLTNIDTSDCDSSLASLQKLARKLHEKDPTKLLLLNSKSDFNSTQNVQSESETEDGYSEENNDDDVENLQNEQENGIKRKISDLESDMVKIPFQDVEKNNIFNNISSTSSLPSIDTNFCSLPVMQTLSPVPDKTTTQLTGVTGNAKNYPPNEDKINATMEKRLKTLTMADFHT